MPTLNIAGRNVSVDDSFLKMSSDQQNAAVDEIAKSIGINSEQTSLTHLQRNDVADSDGNYPMPPVRDLGKDLNDTARSFANGATFGLANRFAAGMGSLTGIGGERDDYSGNLARERQQTAQFESDHPVASGAANLVGAAAVPIGAIGLAAKGINFVTKTLLGMGTGAAIGGVQGAAESPDWTNLPQVGRNTALGIRNGALVGGAIPGAGHVISAGLQKASNLFGGWIPGMSRSASDHLISAVQADTPQAVQSELDRLGPQAMLADAGSSLLGKAQGAAINSDESRSLLVNALKKRNEATNARIMGDVEGALGPAEDPQTIVNAIRARRSALDSTNYPSALNNAPPVDTSSLLANLGPAIGNSVGMESKALTNLRDMLMTERNGAPIPVTDANLLHKIKGEVDNVIHYDQPGLGIPAASLSRQQGALNSFRAQLNDALEQQVPGYAKANAESAALAKRAEAVDAGTQLLSSGKTTPTPERFAGEFSQMQPGEKIAFAKGNRGEIARLLGTKINDLQALKGALQGEGGWNTAKLATVYGQDAADQLTGSVERNLKFRDTYNKVVENSQTAQRTASANSMRPESPKDDPLFGSKTTAVGLFLGPAKKALNYGINSLRPDPTASYGEIARIIAAQGPQRDEAFQAILDAIASRQRASTTAQVFGNRAAVAAAILANDELHNRMKQQ